MHKLYSVLFEDDETVIKLNVLVNSSLILFDNSDDDDDERTGVDESSCLCLDN